MNTENKTNNQDFKNFLNPDNLLKIVIALSILLFSFAIFYRYVFYLPHQNRIKEQKLNECLSDAENRLKKVLEKNSLDDEVARFLFEVWKDAKEECFKKFK
jgi:hypothetical protein